MASFSWNDSYRIGDELIDSQHQYLFTLANDLANSKNKPELIGNVMKLFRYAREHFGHEEELMKQISYPEYQMHAKQHDKLIDQLSVISNDIHHDRWSSFDLHQFMTLWLLGHVVEFDTKLVNTMNEASGKSLAA